MPTYEWCRKVRLWSSSGESGKFESGISMRSSHLLHIQLLLTHLSSQCCHRCLLNIIGSHHWLKRKSPTVTQAWQKSDVKKCKIVIHQLPIVQNRVNSASQNNIECDYVLSYLFISHVKATQDYSGKTLVFLSATVHSSWPKNDYRLSENQQHRLHKCMYQPIPTSTTFLSSWNSLSDTVVINHIFCNSINPSWRYLLTGEW